MSDGCLDFLAEKGEEMGSSENIPGTKSVRGRDGDEESVEVCRL